MLAIGHRARVGVDVLAEQRDLALRPGAASARTSSSTESKPRLTSSPRVYGTTQKLQYLLQPSMIETKARAPCRARRGQVVELLDLREAHVDHRAARAAQLRDHLRQAMQRLRPEHQIDERRARGDRLALLAGDAAADADDAAPGARALSSRHSPSSEKTFSCAFSRTEQVFISSTSACAGSSVAVRLAARAARPPCARSRTRSSGSRRSLCSSGRAWADREVSGLAERHARSRHQT